MSRPELPDDQPTAFERWEVVELASAQPEPDAQQRAQAELFAARQEAIAAGHQEGMQAGRAAGAPGGGTEELGGCSIISSSLVRVGCLFEPYRPPASDD